MRFIGGGGGFPSFSWVSVAGEKNVLKRFLLTNRTPCWRSLFHTFVGLNFHSFKGSVKKCREALKPSGYFLWWRCFCVPGRKAGKITFKKILLINSSLQHSPVSSITEQSSSSVFENSCWVSVVIPTLLSWNWWPNPSLDVFTRPEEVRSSSHTRRLTSSFKPERFKITWV